MALLELGGRCKSAVAQFCTLRVNYFAPSDSELWVFRWSASFQRARKARMASLLRQPHLPHQLSKLWVGTYGVE